MAIEYSPTGPVRPDRNDGLPLSAAQGQAYGAEFWLTYAANSLLMVAISLLYRYADLVSLLGGREHELGWIVGAGMVGSLAMRLSQGVGIDRYGSRGVWLGSVVVFIFSCLGHLLVTTVHGPLVYALRILFATSIAGAFGASITYISRRAAAHRVAEVIGTLGTSGFIGMMGGSLLGDLLFADGQIDRAHVNRMFLTAALVGLAALALALLASRGATRPMLHRRVSIWGVLRRYHPGAILLVGVATGIGVGMPQVFLRTYAHELNIHNLSFYFVTYAPVAFATRLTIRGMPARYGIRPMVWMGLGAMAASMVCYLAVRSQSHLVWPACLAGIGHAFLFPSVVAGGSTRFPERYRGLATTLMLATFDLGTLIGAPLIGTILLAARHFGLPSYPTMFFTVAALLLGLAVVYSLTESKEPNWRPRVRRHRRKSAAPHRGMPAALSGKRRRGLTADPASLPHGNNRSTAATPPGG